MQSNWVLPWTVAAANNFGSVAAMQYRAVNLAGDLAATPQTAIGVMASKPQSGEFGTVHMAGIMKGRFGGAVNSGAAITVSASGFLTAYTAIGSGGGVPVGRALVQVASGDVGEFAGNFLNGGLLV